ncbi:MAG: hypothetical protein R6U94_14720 [Nitriliruptoraceae bacterium]
MSDGEHGSDVVGHTGTSGGTSGGTSDDLMAADRRTLVIGALAMVGLVLVGVVSGSLFASSACDDITPRAVTVPAAGSDLGLLGSALDGLDEDELASLRAELTSLTDELGSITGVAEVPGAASLAATADGVASLGEEVVTLRASGDDAVAAVTLGSGTPVGSGPHLYTLALTNPLTGQVDALQPLDEGLEGLTCQDTALVGSALAFHLDAGDGQLLVLRVEEDGDEPELELRDPVAGQVWAAELRLPTAPAGLAGARLTAGLGPEVIVAGTRTTPGEEAPVFAGVARTDGAALWSLDRVALEATGVPLSDERPTRAEVIAVGDVLALAVLRQVDGDGRADEEAEQDLRSVGPQRLLALDPADGTVRWQAELEPTERIMDARSSGDSSQVVLVDRVSSAVRVLIDTGEDVRSVDGPRIGPLAPEAPGASEESGLPVTSGRAPRAGVAALPAGPTLVGVGERLLVLPSGAAGADGAPADAGLVEVALPVVDVARHPGGVSLLLAGPAAQRALVTFDGAPDAG